MRPVVNEVADTIGSSYKGRRVAVHELAWLIQEDTRPLLVESMLLWSTYQTTAGKRWALVAIYRHPNTSPRWTVDDVCHFTYTLHSREQYDHAPSRHEIRDFARQWFNLYSGFKFLGGGVDELDWRTVVRDDPPTIKELTTDGPSDGTG